eukprot:4201760-Lingulodinium_polyedra.AAC.1
MFKVDYDQTQISVCQSVGGPRGCCLEVPLLLWRGDLFAHGGLGRGSRATPGPFRKVWGPIAFRAGHVG